MRSEIQRGSESLDEGHRCAASFANAVMLSRTSSLIGEERAKECAEHITCELGIPGAAVPEWIGKRQDPLTHRHLRQYAIDKMGGGVCHPSPSARRTESSPLARERNEPVVTAAVAVYTQETMGENATIQVHAQLPFDKVGNGSAPLAGIREE
jgi:hypothetical protein